MSEVIQHPTELPGVAPAAGQVDLAQLDDKHLGQYRHPNERRALVAIVIGLTVIGVVLWLARPILGNVLNFMPTPILRFLSTWFHPERLGLVVIGLLALVAIMDVVAQSSRAWQLVAQAAEVTPVTFPQLAPIVDELRERFDLPRTRVYVSRDAPPTGYTIGVREPYAIVFSSIGVGQLTPAEFKFALGSEMGSIKLGHTLMATLLGNVRMSLPQPFSMLLKFRSILFGTYHHAQALSCDRIGVVATRDMAPALSTLVKQNLGQVRGAKIDVNSLESQSVELGQGASGAVLRMTMLLNAQPFAIARLGELVRWAGPPPAPASTGPAKPPPPTPAASAAAAAKSAAAAAKSAAEAAASAAAVLAALNGQAPDAPALDAEAAPGSPEAAAPAGPSADTAISAPPAAASAAAEGGSVSVSGSRPPHE